MKQRINYNQKGKQAMIALYGIGKHLSQCTIEPKLLNLIYFHVSQINRCCYCLDMHSKDLRVKGETEQRLYLLAAWKESPFYSDKEKASLAWAESLTKLSAGLVPYEIYNEARKYFSEEELIDLTLGIIAINSYNRLNIAFGAEVGTYQPGQWK